MNNYEKIKPAVHYILEQQKKKISLAAIAKSVHLSPYDFQNLFSLWSGVSPKQLLQVLTLENAKRHIHTQATKLEKIDSAPHSSRNANQHKHTVNLTTRNLTEYKNQGKQLEIVYGYHLSPVGEVFIALTDYGICALAFIQPEKISAHLSQLKLQWPNATIKEDLDITQPYMQRMCKQQTADQPLSLLVNGTSFQIQVWQALLNIPLGEVRSYSDIGAAIGKPKSVRAIGTAIGNNPVAFFIPCHRVLQKSGGLGGYHWGLERKYALLMIEAALTE